MQHPMQPEWDKAMERMDAIINGPVLHPYWPEHARRLLSAIKRESRRIEEIVNQVALETWK